MAMPSFAAKAGLVLGGLLILVAYILPEIFARTVLRSTSPNGDIEIEVRAVPAGLEEQAQVRVTMNGWRSVLVHDREERHLRVSEVIWRPDSSQVLVFVCSSYTSPLIYAYDFKQRRAVDSSHLVEVVRRALRIRYLLDSPALTEFEGDPMLWACTPGSGAFERFENLLGEKATLPPLGDDPWVN